MELLKTKSFDLATITRGNRDAQKLAIVIPGRLDTKDYIHSVRHIEYLGERGYFALAFDPPGTWDSPGTLDLYTTTNCLSAIDEIIAHYGGRSTLLLGHSRGGTVAMLGTSNPAVSGVIAIMASYGPPTPPGAASVQRGFNSETRDEPPGGARTEERRTFDLPMGYFLDGARHDPVEALRRCAKPKLLIAGTHDRFMSPDAVRTVFASIHEPKMLREIHTEHDYRYHPEAVAETNEIIGQFLDGYLSD